MIYCVHEALSSAICGAFPNAIRFPDIRQENAEKESEAKAKRIKFLSERDLGETLKLEKAAASATCRSSSCTGSTSVAPGTSSSRSSAGERRRAQDFV